MDLLGQIGRTGSRRLAGRAVLLAALVSGLVFFSSSPAAHAAVVTGTPVQVGCSTADLIAAFDQVESAGSGVMDLAPGCTYTLTAPAAEPPTFPASDGPSPLAGPIGLPILHNLTGPVVIHGQGATIERSSAAGTPAFRLMALGLPTWVPDPNISTCPCGYYSTDTTVDVTIDDLIMTGGYSPYDGQTFSDRGGAIDQLSGKLTLTDDTFTGNSSGKGGAVESQTGTLDVIGSLFQDNTAVSFGSAIHTNAFQNGAGQTVLDSAFIDNNGARNDAALVANGPGLISNNTFTGNDSGALLVSQPPDVTFNTMIDNGGYAIFNDGGVVAGQLIGNIITGACVGPPGTTGGLVMLDGGYNVEPDGNHCSLDNHDVIGQPVGAGPLADNGGPTETMAIGQGSPAFRLVPKALCPPTDARGAARPQPGATACNAGAYETQAIPTTLAQPTPPGGFYHQTVTLASTLTADTSGTVGPIPTVPPAAQVVLAAGSASCAATVSADGAAACKVTVADGPGSSFLSAYYEGGPTGVGDDYYVRATAVTPFTVTAAPTATTVGAATSTFSSAAQQVGLTATVTSKFGTVDQGSVTFAVSDPSGASVASCASPVMSSGTANATCTLPGGTLPGSYTITASYSDPTGDYGPSGGTSTLTLAKAPTSISESTIHVVPSLRRHAATFVATLTGPSDQPVTGQAITFTAGRTYECTATTSPAGVATCTVGIRGVVAVLRARSSTATYAGGSDYRGSSVTVADSRF